MLEIKSTDIVSIRSDGRTDGFDGHSYRAVSYWPEQFTNVDITNPESVNGIAKVKGSIGDKLRSKSKAPTFA